MAIKSTILALLTLCCTTSVYTEARLKHPDRLQRIKQSGILRVLIRPGDDTYQTERIGLPGYEHDLVKQFANQLGVKVQFILMNTDNFDTLASHLKRDAADLAASGIAITESRKKHVRFSESYNSITEQLVFNNNLRRPKRLRDLQRGILEIGLGTSHQDTLQRLKPSHPGLEWNTNSRLDTAGLLFLVNERLLDYTIANSNQVRLLRRFHPHIRVAFDISPPRELAWAVIKSNDSSLIDEINRFITQQRRSKMLERLHDRYYGHIDSLDKFSLRKFITHTKTRLPQLRIFFEQAGFNHGVDWRLLAAIGYQESQWNIEARSPTGVRGIMMLTQSTAREIGVIDRLDPEQSIKGGAHYYSQQIYRLYPAISGPDRNWMALVAYNTGWSHLEFARQLTRQLGGNENRWLDLKKVLYELDDEKWKKKGINQVNGINKPVSYVERIRNYYDLLLWLTEENWLERKVMLSDHNETAVILTEHSTSIF